ncbi:MAG TPA: asparagine synthase (glutamine-hydrolyzing) [Lentisphaeria bacterium]|nr:MAG: asparagine synthase (glutamine-hydrolyzing) [Lentisphaerae bacterium GWF2_49_21]HBC87129.1 asparagine synthase (glutamine-hydrolyzing) [Lentisphaeria bacterium]
MCGFVGIISKKKSRFPENKLREMTGMITHRGPDDEGFFFHEDWLALGFRRLSIIDLSSKGHQPMISHDGRHVIVFNGEIYNYCEIRNELEKENYPFQSHTDTEVILAAYRKWGTQCMSKFIGMFAFIIADLKEKTVFLSRDQLGIKPLFHYEDADNHVFCSEIKSLLPYCSLEPNLNSVNEYLVFRSVVGKNTLFKNVFSLEAGHFMEYKDGCFSEKEYFNLSGTFKPDYSKSFEEACTEVEKSLEESVRLHLRSDVELGVQLSGGVDSSLIAAMASRQVRKKFHTFSISFKESSYDESEYQKRVSSRYNTEHHDFPMGEGDFTDLLMKSLWYFEHPINDPNSVCTYFLAEKARKYITVMLAGEGADESFLGYSRFLPSSIRTLRTRSFLHRNPAIREILFKLTGKSIFNITRYNPAMYVLSYSDLNLTDKLLKGDDSSFTGRLKAIEEAGGDVLNEALLQDQDCDLAQWFWRADRMGMAASMELRVPFCTVPMFRLANSIPYEMRVFNGERKAVLKKVAEKYIDNDQIYRKKIGFGTPIDVWLNREGPYSRLYSATVESNSFRSRSFIDQSHFNHIYSSHKNGSYREVNSGYLWTYFNLELWHRIFFEDGWKSLCI